ncbi:hypothetical protein [Pseudomonas tolaasii]|uniref:hypothetical protein n=1 Tax=Pseudomonas tolaasii TaxID=29442 RepID=UPI0018C885C1|nr:hypothetical protein [Pseudomonas tolaasii]
MVSIESVIVVVRDGLAVAQRDGHAHRIAAVKNDEMGNVPMLVSATKVDAQHKLLQYYESTEISDWFIHESHLLIGDVYVMLRADSLIAIAGKPAPTGPSSTQAKTLFPYIVPTLRVGMPPGTLRVRACSRWAAKRP